MMCRWKGLLSEVFSNLILQPIDLFILCKRGKYIWLEAILMLFFLMVVIICGDGGCVDSYDDDDEDGYSY